MSMRVKLVLSILGIFIGGATGYYEVHQAAAFDSRFYVGIFMAGLGPLGAYFVGLTQKAPWDGPIPPASK